MYQTRRILYAYCNVDMSLSFSLPSSSFLRFFIRPFLPLFPLPFLPLFPSSFLPIHAKVSEDGATERELTDDEAAHAKKVMGTHEWEEIPDAVMSVGAGEAAGEARVAGEDVVGAGGADAPGSDSEHIEL